MTCDETHHSLRSVKVVMVSSFSAARSVLLVLLAVLLLLLFLHRCGPTISALCYPNSKFVIRKAAVMFNGREKLLCELHVLTGGRRKAHLVGF